MANISGINYIDSLLFGSDYRWNRSSGFGTAATVTYSFMESAPAYASADDKSGFSPLADDQRAAVDAALALWSEVANIDFVKVSDAGDGGQIRVGSNAQSGSSAYSYIAGPDNPAQGDVYWNNTRSASFEAGQWGFHTMTHELGHAIGLKHPGNYNSVGDGSQPGPFLPSGEDNVGYTVMSYYGSASGLLPSAPMLYDVAAIQHLYGARTSTRAGNSTYTPSSGVLTTIWDGGGTDLVDCSGQSGGVTIDLRAGGFSSIGRSRNLAIAYNVTIENATGGEGADTIIGNDAANTLSGGGGDDAFEAGNADSINGGSGADRVTLAAGGSIRITDVETVTGNLGSDTVVIGDSTTLVVLDVDQVIGGGDNTVVLSGATSASLTGVRTVLGTAGSGARATFSSAAEHVLASGVDALDAGEGADWVDLGDGGNSINLGGVETLMGGSGADRVKLEGAGNRLIIAGIETLTGEVGTDDVTLGRRGSTIVLSAIETVNGTSTADWVNLADGGNGIACVGIETLIGGAGNDAITLVGASNIILTAVETLYGSAGGDWVTLGNRGNIMTVQAVETLIGGNGTDAVTLGGGGNTVALAAIETLVGGIDADIVTLGRRGSTISIAGVESIVGTSTADWLNLMDGGNGLACWGVETLIGGAGNDAVWLGQAGTTIMAAIETLHGSAGSDAVVLGNRGNTVLVAGIETITGGLGADIVTLTAGTLVFSGGGGNDALNIAGGTAMVVAGDPGSGVDTVTGFSGISDRLAVRGALAVIDSNHDGRISFGLRATGAVRWGDEGQILGTTLAALDDTGFASFRAAFGAIAAGTHGLVLARDATATGLYYVGDHDRDGSLTAEETVLLTRIQGVDLTAGSQTVSVIA